MQQLFPNSVSHSWTWLNGFPYRRWQVCWLVVLAVSDITRAGVPTTGGNGDSAPCVFPFVYRGTEQFDCLVNDTETWCATTANYDRDFKWGLCPPLPNEDGEIKVREKHSKKADTEAASTESTADIYNDSDTGTAETDTPASTDGSQKSKKKTKKIKKSDVFGTLKEMAKAKVKHLIAKGKARMANITNTAVKAFENKKWDTVKKLKKEMERQTHHFAAMRLKEAKDLAESARDEFAKKLKQAKGQIEKVKEAVKGSFIQGKAHIKHFGEMAKKKLDDFGMNVKPNLEHSVQKLSLMPKGEGKRRFAYYLTGIITQETDKAARQTAKIKELFGKVQEALRENVNESQTKEIETMAQMIQGNAAIDQDVGACRERPCLNGACKVTAVGGFICICNPGYKGQLCEVLGSSDEEEPSAFAPKLLPPFFQQQDSSIPPELGAAPPLRGPPPPLKPSSDGANNDDYNLGRTTTPDPFVKANVVVANKPEDEDDTLENLEGRPESEHPANQAKSLAERLNWSRHKNKVFGAIGAIGSIGLLIAIIVAVKHVSSMRTERSFDVCNPSLDERSRLLPPVGVLKHDHAHKHRHRRKKSKDRKSRVSVNLGMIGAP